MITMGEKVMTAAREPNPKKAAEGEWRFPNKFQVAWAKVEMVTRMIAARLITG